MQPSIALTFQDLQIRVAEIYGVASYGLTGDTAAAVPTDTHDLDMVKRLVNDGWRRFIGANAKWNWLLPTFSITFDSTGLSSDNVKTEGGDVPAAARYYLPSGFYGQLVSNFTYSPDGPRTGIHSADELSIREMYAGSSTTTGDPYVFAIRPLLARGNATERELKRWEVIFFPTPDSAETVTARARIYPNALVNDGDYHAAGFQFDEAVLAAGMAEAEIQREHKAGPKEKAYMEKLAVAMALDRGSAPRRLGYNGDRSDGAASNRHPYYSGADTYTSGSTVTTF
jgi:hypothetical protein